MSMALSRPPAYPCQAALGKEIKRRTAVPSITTNGSFGRLVAKQMSRYEWPATQLTHETKLSFIDLHRDLHRT